MALVPKSIQKLPKIGLSLAPDGESIARLVPDLIVLQPVSSELTDRLDALRIRFIEVPHGTLGDLYTGIARIATAAAVLQLTAVLDDRIRRRAQPQLSALRRDAVQPVRRLAA